MITMAEVIKRHREAGGTWFDSERMKEFRRRLNDKCDDSPLVGYDGHVYFCFSWESQSRPPPGNRLWEVMRLLPDGTIETARGGLESHQARDIMRGLLPRTEKR